MLERILESCKYVTSKSKYVKINDDKISEFVNSTKDFKNVHWLENSPFGLLDLDIDEIMKFLLIYHSLGFSYWGNPKWFIQTENETLDGAYAMIYILINKIKQDKDFLDMSKLKNISKNEFKHLLKGNVEIPLIDKRYENIISVANKLYKLGGSLYNCIKDITVDEDLFNYIISEFEVFNDTTVYKGKNIYLYKLAQLLTFDILYIRKIKENIKVDYSNLSGCPDYKIPQILRMLGILEYNEELSNIIDSKTEIKKDSNYEIEIRANMVVAINRIKKLLNNENINSIEINDHIWLKGQDKTKEIKPYHLTRTWFY